MPFLGPIGTLSLHIILLLVFIFYLGQFPRPMVFLQGILTIKSYVILWERGEAREQCVQLGWGAALQRSAARYDRE